MTQKKEHEELAQNVQRFKSIGKEIAELYEESKTLRASIAAATDELELGHIKVNTEEAVEFLVGNLRVSVVAAKDEEIDDFTILIRELKSI